MEKKLYIGCALTDAPEDFRSQVENFKDQLRQKYTVFDFIGLVGGTSADVYRWDIGHCVRDCDAFIGICDYPSTGLGWELSEATRLGKSVLAIAHEQSSVTRLVLGAAAVEPNVHFANYTDLPEVIPMVDSLFTAD
jgi:hypothetical protein